MWLSCARTEAIKYAVDTHHIKSSNYDAIIQIENAVFNFAEETDFVQTGDVNSDDIINILDVILTVNIILGNSDFNSSADINNDEVIDVLDIVQLVNMILS